MWNAHAFDVTIALSTVPFPRELGGTGVTSSGEANRAQVDSQARNRAQVDGRKENRSQEVDRP
jgi:hypothetical protein